MNELDALIEAAERAADTLEASIAKSKNTKPDLDSAVSAAANLVKSLPASEQAEWSSRLGNALQADENHVAAYNDKPPNAEEKSKPCSSQADTCCECGKRQEEVCENQESTMKWVECPRQCGAKFCGQACKRKGLKNHSLSCVELRRRAIMKKIGVGEQEEVF